MRKTLLRSLVVLLTLLGVGCAGPRAYTRGEYADPNVIEMLSDKFNENDLQLIAKKMVESLASAPQFQNLPTRPVVIVGKFKNSTSEHIDLKSLADKIQVQLVKTNKFSFQAKEAREEIAEEYEYQGSGYVKQGTAKGPGNQVSADYVLTGEISSIVQEVGADKTVYYKVTTKLNNLSTGILDWTDEKELRKKFEKQGVSW